MTVRLATPGDVPALVVLAYTMRDESPVYRALPWDPERVEANLHRLVGHEWLLVAEDAAADSRPIVVGFLGFVVDEEPWTGVCQSREMLLFVHEPWRREGHARALVDAAVAHAGRSGARWFTAGSTLGVGEDAAAGVYAAAGFHRAGFIVRKVLDKPAG